MAPEALAKPLRAHAWACRSDELPSDTAEDLISDKPNRWNVEGEPTVYLSGAPGLALIESGRHPEDLSGKSFLIEVDVRIPLVVDLRDSTTCRTLGLPRDPTWVLDREQTREAASAYAGPQGAFLAPYASCGSRPTAGRSSTAPTQLRSDRTRHCPRGCTADLDHFVRDVFADLFFAGP